MAQHQPAQKFYLFILLILFSLLMVHYNLAAQSSPAMLSGIIFDKSTGEAIPDCNISALPAGAGAVSDSLGLFVLQLPYGDYTVEFSYLGYETAKRQISLDEQNPRIRLRIALIPRVIEGRSVTVSDERFRSSTKVQRMDHTDIRNMPTLYSDALRTVKILPGVSSNNELSSAYNVRGGNFDENLIYLNGYEIYRPFLLRQGVEENQSLINPDLVETIRFHNGAFPASLGDKMSSALEVNYDSDAKSITEGTIRADLLNMGAAAKGRTGKLNWAGGVRYANPGLFVNKLQTDGSYRPLFTDIQLLMSYPLGNTARLELFLLRAHNQFDLTPKRWTGNFKTGLADIKAIEIDYSGEKTYSFTTGLAGLRFYKRVNPRTRFNVSLTRFNTREAEQIDLTGDIFYDEDATEGNDQLRYLKSRIERADNSLRLQSSEIQFDLQHVAAAGHFVQAGFQARLVKLENHLDEYFAEEGDEVLLETPLIEKKNQREDLNSVNGYLQDAITFGDKWKLNLGMRLLYFHYNKETLFSPRVSLDFQPAENNSLNLSWGYYYQPPFFYELQNKESDRQTPLKSQRAIHYILGWEHRFNQELTFQAETYYKQLDRLIPYYLDQLKLIYEDENANRGYAFGLDLLLHGQIVKNMNSWIGYSYLKTRERPIDGSSGYSRRLLDQTHTVRFFVQDKVPRYPNVQAHLRLLFGSGYLYYPRTEETDPTTGDSYLAVAFDRQEKFQSYARADLGLSARFKLGGERQLIVMAEVLNVFNHINVAAYSWFRIFRGHPVRIPHIYTRRFFNLGIELGF